MKVNITKREYEALQYVVEFMCNSLREITEPDFRKIVQKEARYLNKIKTKATPSTQVNQTDNDTVKRR